MSSFRIEQPQVVQKKARIALYGGPGAGKTEGALRIAHGAGGRIVLIDTEDRRGAEKVGLPDDKDNPIDFEYINFGPPYSPERYVEVMEMVENDFDWVLLDGASPEWDGDGGILRLVDKLTEGGGDNRRAWAQATPRHDAFVQKILRCNTNIIVTIRAKQKMVIANDGKEKIPHKIPVEPIQRAGLEFEFSFVFGILRSGNLAFVDKAPWNCLGNADPFRITCKTGETIGEWLRLGVDPAAAQAEQDKLREVESASMRDEMLARLDNIANPHELTNWVKKHAGEIKGLLLTDQQLVTDKGAKVREALNKKAA